MATPHPIQLLPPELVGQVLLNGFKPYNVQDQSDRNPYGDRQDYLSQICLVSRYWHDVACSIPDLWSLFQVTLRGKRMHGVRRQKLQLERARNADLHVRLVVCDPYRIEERAFRKCWEQLSMKSSQWRSLYMAEPSSYVYRDHGQLIPTSLPNLIEMRSGVVLGSNINCEVPKLHHFGALQENCGFPFASASTLRSMRITGPSSNAITALQEATNLETLEVVDGLDLSESLRNLTYLHLKHLTWNGEILDLQNFLSIATAPCLHTITILRPPPSYRSWDIPSESPVKQSFPSLSTIVYRNTSVRSDQLRPLLRVLQILLETECITVYVTMFTPPAVGPHSFWRIDEDMQKLEEMVQQVVWKSEPGDARALARCSGTREYYGRASAPDDREV